MSPPEEMASSFVPRRRFSRWQKEPSQLPWSFPALQGFPFVLGKAHGCWREVQLHMTGGILCCGCSRGYTSAQCLQKSASKARGKNKNSEFHPGSELVLHPNTLHTWVLHLIHKHFMLTPPGNTNNLAFFLRGMEATVPPALLAYQKHCPLRVPPEEAASRAAAPRC